MDCNRLLPDLVDERARNDPCGIFAKIPVGDSYPCTYRNITNSSLATAVDHVVDLIVAKFGHSDNHECMAYLGLNDVRYTIVLLANIKAGFKTFFPSPRNSKEAQSSLFAELSCSKLMTTSPNPAGIPGADSMRTLIVPGLDDLLGLDPDVVVPKPYCKVFEDVRADPVFVLHTSGSTGIPKPLTYTNEFVSRLYHTQTLLPPKGYISVDERFRNGTYLITLPPFHIAGLAFTFLLPALFKSVPVYPTAGTPLMLEGFLCAMDSAQFDWAFLPPVVVDALGRDERALGIVAERLRYLFFTGGSVPRDTGKEVAKRIQLNQVLGSSECAAIPLIRSEHGLPEEDWHYVKIHPRANVEFEYRFDDPPNKCCELVQVRQQDETNDIRFQPVFCHFGDLNSYETKDLFVEHPTLDNYFTHVGRTDDIIVFLNGEKTNPVTFQSEVAKHPKVRSALLAGEQREEAVLIIEPFGEEERTEKLDRKLIDEVWPTVDHINGRSLKHAIVAKDRIIVARSSKPFLRTGKGTVQVRATLAMYKPDIDQLFREDLSETNTWSKYPTLQPPETVDVIDVVRRVARDSNQEVTSDATNFFSVGMDSLRALHMQRELGRIFPHVGMDPRVVYANPTIKSLAEAIMQASGPNEVTAQPRIDEVSDMIHHYKARVDALCKEDIISWQGTTHSDASKTSRRNGTTSDLNKALLGLDSLGIATGIPPAEDAILLTGSTGALGSHILNLLLAAGSRKVFCLNRSVDSRAVQIRQNQSRRLPTDLPEHRVTFLTGDLTSHHFGLPLSTYETLQRSVTQVIHNAWPVDFNQPLQAFADCLDGVVNLVSFTYNCNLDVSLLFVSSIASVARYSEEGTIPEQNILDSGVPAAMGYGQSKYVAERVLAYASEALRIKTISVRVGQLCGDDWNIKEWFPSLITSSLHLKVLPKTLGAAADSSSLRWVPMDAAAKVLLDLSDVRGSTEPNITFNLLHPRPSQWSSFLPTVRRVLTEIALGRGEPQVELASYDEWVERLQKSGLGHVDDRSMTQNPALKLLPFFESLRFGGNFQRNYSIDQSLEHSANLRGLRQLEENDLKAWIELWVFGAEDSVRHIGGFS